MEKTFKSTDERTTGHGNAYVFKGGVPDYLVGIRKLNTRRHTITQALASPEYTLMEKQRLRTFGREMFGQLRVIKW